MKKIDSIQVNIKLCPECNSHNFRYDNHHKELYCFNCGVVLIAPPSTDFITPDIKTVTITINIHEAIIE